MDRTWNAKTPVLVLKLEHYGSLGIIRSLGRLGVPLYGVDKNPRAVASRSRFCHGSYTWDLEHSPPQATLEFLIRVAKAIGGRPILIPTSDEMAGFVADYARHLQEHFHFHSHSSRFIASLCSKKEMYFLAKRFSVPVPTSFFPTSWDDVIEGMKHLSFPVMLKGIKGAVLEERTGKRMVIIQNIQELESAYMRMENPTYPNLMIQEYIQADDDSAWLYNGYFDSQSNCLVAFTGKKIRQNPVHTGMTSFGLCTWNQEIVDTTNSFLRAIGYKGIVDIDFRYDMRDRKYKLLDINPRIGASFRLFVSQNDLDVARALYLDMTNQPVQSTSSVDGRTWVVEDKDLLSSYRYFKEGKLQLLQWIASFRRIDEAGYFASDDLLPFWQMLKNHIDRTLFKLRWPGIDSITKRHLRDFTSYKSKELYSDQQINVAR